MPFPFSSDDLSRARLGLRRVNTLDRVIHPSACRSELGRFLPPGRWVPWRPEDFPVAQNLLVNVLTPGDVMTANLCFSDWHSSLALVLDAVDTAANKYKETLEKQAVYDYRFRRLIFDQLMIIVQAAITVAGITPAVMLIQRAVGGGTSATEWNASTWIAQGIGMDVSIVASNFVNRMTEALKGRVCKVNLTKAEDLSIKDIKYRLLGALNDLRGASAVVLGNRLDKYFSLADVERVLWHIHYEYSKASGSPLLDRDLVAAVETYRDGLRAVLRKAIKDNFGCPLKVSGDAVEQLSCALEKSFWADYILRQPRNDEGQLKARLGVHVQERIVALNVVVRRSYTNLFGLDLTGYDARMRRAEAGQSTVFVGRHRIGEQGHRALLEWAERYKAEDAFARLTGLAL